MRALNGASTAKGYERLLTERALGVDVTAFLAVGGLAVTAPSSSTLTLSFFASIIGEVGLTVIFTVAVSVWPSLSVIV